MLWCNEIDSILEVLTTFEQCKYHIVVVVIFLIMTLWEGKPTVHSQA